MVDGVGQAAQRTRRTRRRWTGRPHRGSTGPPRAAVQVQARPGAGHRGPGHGHLAAEHGRARQDPHRRGPRRERYPSGGRRVSAKQREVREHSGGLAPVAQEGREEHEAALVGGGCGVVMADGERPLEVADAGVGGEEAREEHPVPVLVGDFVGEAVDVLEGLVRPLQPLVRTARVYTGYTNGMAQKTKH